MAADPDRIARRRRQDTIDRAEALAAPKAAARAKRLARNRATYAERRGRGAADGAAKPRGKVKIDNSKLRMPFHDITDDPYSIRV